MRKLLWLLAVVCCTASAAFAGVNSGGVLVVHNTGLAWSTNDTPRPPVTAPPVSCSAVVNQGELDAPFVWKIYAVFPQASAPVMSAVVFGDAINPGSGGVTIDAAGLCNTGDLESTDGVLWPNGGGLGVAFTAGNRTGHIEEIYWFGGSGYTDGLGGATPEFCAAPWVGHICSFADGSFPPVEDEIGGYGCLGFGAAGYTPCPAEPGACCEFSGACTIEMQVTCLAPRVWNGAGSCSPNPCPLPPVYGSCCYPDGTCLVTEGPGFAGGCTAVWLEGGVCVPNTCAQPLGACCLPDYTCEVRLLADCSYLWYMFGVCDPNPCPAEPTGSCCVHDGSCTVTVVGACTGVWTLGGVCVPNTCAQPDGACCSPYTCAITKAAACVGAGWVWTMDGLCDPNPCPPPPAEAACCHAGWINGQQGWCTVTLLADCPAPHVWHPEWVSCTPNPCPVIPTVESNWGAIKNIYR